MVRLGARIGPRPPPLESVCSFMRVARHGDVAVFRVVAISVHFLRKNRAQRYGEFPLAVSVKSAEKGRASRSLRLG